MFEFNTAPDLKQNCIQKPETVAHVSVKVLWLNSGKLSETLIQIWPLEDFEGAFRTPKTQCENK